ncbi:hypothetical protein GCM10022627_36640 [Haloarcula argentinensis]
MTVLHLLEFGNNIIVPGFLGSVETLLEIRATGIDWLMEDDDLSECSEVAE